MCTLLHDEQLGLEAVFLAESGHSQGSFLTLLSQGLRYIQQAVVVVDLKYLGLGAPHLVGCWHVFLAKDFVGSTAEGRYCKDEPVSVGELFLLDVDTRRRKLLAG